MTNYSKISTLALRSSLLGSMLAGACMLSSGACMLSCGGQASSASTSDSQLMGPLGSGNGTGGGTGTNGTGGTASGTGTGTSSSSSDPSSGDITGLSTNPGTVATPPDTSCIQQGVEIETVTPTITLLVDRSQSMNARFGMGAGALDRWNTIRNVLVEPTNGFVSKLQAKVRFGLSMYTGLQAQAADPMTGTPAVAASCPDLIEVPNALNNFQMIHDVFMAHEVGDNTPTAEALTAVTAKLEAVTDVGPKVIVLATDGDPDTCAAPDSNGTDPPRAASLAAVTAAFGKGISTYVISVGNEATATHLQALASAGQGGAMGAKYYEALDNQGLIDAFSNILRGVVSCDFNLNGTVTPQNAPRGTVKIDNTPLVFNDPNGWTLVGESTIRLQGTACENVKLSVSFVDISFPCGVLIIR